MLLDLNFFITFSFGFYYKYLPEAFRDVILHNEKGLTGMQISSKYFSFF